MDALLSQVQTLAAAADEAGRKKIIDSLRDAAISLETPWDSIQRIAYLNFQVVGAKIGINLKLFEILKDAKAPMTVEQLAEKTGADPRFLGRLLRYLASVRMIKEADKDSFSATKVTEALTVPGFAGGVQHYFDLFGPILQKFPDFLEETKYKNPDDNTHCPFNKGWDSPLPAFVWLQQQPKLVGYFGSFMVAQRGEMPGWLSVFPIEEETKGWDPEKPVFVDIGGGFGHQCADLRAKYPNLPGKVILQDLPHAIDNAVPATGVEAQVHDFFQPQPVKGAKYYYLRNIIHDWPDAKCVEILKNTMSAMGPDSVILIDDMVLPPTNVHWQATQIDMAMMTALASMERTDEQWEKLLDSAGLKIVKTYPYTLSLRDTIIVAVPK